MCKADFYGTLIVSKDADLNYLKNKIKEGLDCDIRLVSSNAYTNKFDIEGSGHINEDGIEDFLEEITPLTKSGYILYRMPDGTKWRHCFNSTCQEWVEENLEYRRSINGKKEAMAQLMTYFPPSSVVIIDPPPECLIISLG